MKFVYPTKSLTEEFQNLIIPLDAPADVSLSPCSSGQTVKNLRERHRAKAASEAHPARETSRPNPVWGDDVPLTLPEAARLIGMPLPTLKDKIYSREIASLKIGGRRKVRPSALRAYAEQSEIPAL